MTRPTGAARRALAGALAGALLACSGQSTGSTGEGHGPAPDFALPDLAGRTVRLSDHRGRTVLIDFWATWCPPCVFQVPELNRFWAEQRGRGDLAVIGVAVDVEGAEVVAPWVDEYGVEYTIVLGDEALARQFGVIGFPTLVVVRPDGVIDSRHAGILERDELDRIVSPLRAAADPRS